MSNLIWQKLLEKFAGDPSVRQLIFVKCTSGSNADFIMYTKGNGNWKELLSCPAFIGKKGLGKEKRGI